jgi:DNA-binding transcriptional MerR regulator
LTSDPERRNLLQIGQVAERVGLSLRTVRYYEEVGLLTPTTRSAGGFRLYAEEQVERLRILKGMKPFGLTLEEIRALMELFDRSEDAARLSPEAGEAIAAALDAFAARAAERARKLEQHQAEVERLRGRMQRRADELRSVPASRPQQQPA